MAITWDVKLEVEAPGAMPIGHCEECDELHVLAENGLCDYCNAVDAHWAGELYESVIAE